MRSGAVPQTAPILILTRRYSFGRLNFATYAPGDIHNATENAILRACDEADWRDHSSTLGGSASVLPSLTSHSV
jgi:hypothetical protein